MSRKWLAQQRLSLCVGVGITLVAAVLHYTGWTAPLEWATYDWLVRNYSRIPASSRILHVDLDDEAISRFGSWPWPRDIDGQVVSILHELGAEQIVLDFLWTERKGAEVRAPGLEPHADLEGPVKKLGQLSKDNIVTPDDELADALRDSGPIYLAMFDEGGESTSSPSDSRLFSRMGELLERDFSLTSTDLARRLNVSLQAVEPLLARIKRHVARKLVAAHFSNATQPAPTAQQIHTSLLKTPFDRKTADRKDILDAYDRELGLRNLRLRCQPIPPGLAGKLPVVSGITPPLYKLTAVQPPSSRPSEGIRPGFANWRPEHEQGGILRAIPLMWQWDDLLIEQLGFAAARDALGIRPQDLSIDDQGCLLIATNRQHPPIRIQLDHHGQMLINWHVTRGGWQRCFSHLPIAEILCILDARQCMHQNNVLRSVRLNDAIQVVNPNVSSNPSEQEQSLAIDLVRQTWAQLANEPNPTDPVIAEEYERFKEANRLITEVIPDIDATNAKIAEQEKRLLDRLRPVVKGRTCFVGYTATAVADMVHTPPYEWVPGVLVHSQIFNSFVQNRFRAWASIHTQVLVILAMGLIVTLIATSRGPRASLTSALAIMTVFLVFNAWVVFARMDFFLPLTTALLTSFVTWALVVMIRYLVTDRQRRWFSHAVARYVSPAMARQIGDSAKNLTFDPVVAEVTCFFSDLAGFTTLSEKLGPQGTRAILNPYLEMMSSTLHQHQALINKFMGDGIFAFFNPPILPCSNHQSAACDAALSCQQALSELIARNADSPIADQFRRLSMRIGIASGHAFVGDYGSEDKLDYTCMGDIVNLAARLESANKQFGTRIMVAGSTYDSTAQRFVFRRLGLIQVKGQTRAVPVYELIGWHDRVSPEHLEYADLFSSAVLAFSRQDWQSANNIFHHCLGLRPDDGAVSRYLAMIEIFRASPPTDNWQGTLELTEK